VSLEAWFEFLQYHDHFKSTFRIFSSIKVRYFSVKIILNLRLRMILKSENSLWIFKEKFSPHLQLSRRGNDKSIGRFIIIFIICPISNEPRLSC
jgi:hypothetical protein